MKAKARCILIVDDEPPIQRILQKNLMIGGYEVLIADCGEDAVSMARHYQPDLMLLDICLPGDIDGVDVCIQVRKFTQMPIIVLSAISEEKQKVKALDFGADDYLTKPFNNDELQARVRACLRRSMTRMETQNHEPEILVSEDDYLRMDTVRRQVHVGTQEIRLTPTEFELLRQLMLNTGKVLTHRVLLRSVWGPEYGEEADYLRVYIRQLRRKIEVDPSHPRYIVTESGVGYVFRPQGDGQNF